MNKRFSFYLGITLDALAMAVAIRIFLGASPFATFVENASLVSPLTPGTVSFIYSTLTLFLIKWLNKQKFYFQGLVYNFIFAIILDLWFFILPELISKKEYSS